MATRRQFLIATLATSALALKRDGHSATMREFEGRHQLPDDLAADATVWLKSAKGLAV